MSVILKDHGNEEKEHKLRFYGTVKSADPGTARYGNFMNYYQFNDVAQRLNLLPRDLIDVVKVGLGYCYPEKLTIKALDVGCNCGDLTTAMYEHLKSGNNAELRIEGIDLDPVLICRAREKNKYPSNISFAVRDIMDEKENNDRQYHVTFCFAVTMWIHLNHGDWGLRSFLKKLCRWSDYLILEPQPWKCYLSASRRMRRAGHPHFQDLDQLNLRNSVVEDIKLFTVKECGMEIEATYGPTKWDRQIIVFKKERLPF